MRILLYILLFGTLKLTAQTPPPLYVHLVSHNEPTDTLQQPVRYSRAKANALQLAAIVDAKGAKWNLQTSDGFVYGARQDQAASGGNIFSVLASPPYDDNVEIDPRNKNFPGRNIADQWYLLDSLGAHPTTTVGGFVYYVCPPGNPSLIDWWQYTDSVTGSFYGNRIKFDLLSGAGSLEPHCNDLNDFGIFKPDTVDNFYQHNPSRNLWCIGTGCAPLLDSMADEMAIFDQIRREIDSIQSGLWPSDKFYVTRIMTNQREFGPMFFQKIARLIDSLNTLPSTHFQWASIRDCYNAFQTWRFATSQDYSQWQCGQTLTGLEERESFPVYVYPNPANDKVRVDFNDAAEHTISIYSVDGLVLKTWTVRSGAMIDLASLSSGAYWMRCDGTTVRRLIKY